MIATINSGNKQPFWGKMELVLVFSLAKFLVLLSRVSFRGTARLSWVGAVVSGVIAAFVPSRVITRFFAEEPSAR